MMGQAKGASRCKVAASAANCCHLCQKEAAKKKNLGD